MVTSTNTILGIPAIPEAVVEDAGLKAQLDAMKEAIEVLTGARGDPNSRALTLGEATEDGETDLFITNRVVETAIGAPVSARLSGDVAGTGLFADDGTVVIPANLQLPNIVKIEGGAADTVYTGSASGPYGIEGAPEGGTTGQVLTKLSATDGDFDWDDAGGGGSAIVVQDDGSTLTSGVTKLNFVGFTLSEDVADEITINNFAAPASTSYAPGYDYTQQSTTTFTVDLADASGLFFPGRRLQFDSAGTFTYGSITAVDFDSTHANDTFVTMSMEDGGTVPATISEIYLVSGTARWSAIATDPFSSTPINGIATGAIGGTQWWVAVGDSGKLYTSTDAGVTWTSRTATGTSGNLNAVTYDPNAETFYIGGVDSDTDQVYIGYSTNGSSWTGTTPSWTQGTGDYCSALAYNAAEDYLIIMAWDNSAGGYDSYVHTGGSMSSYNARLAGANVGTAIGAPVRAGGSNAWCVAVGGSGLVYEYSNYTDTTATTRTSGIGTAQALHFEYLNRSTAENYYIVGTATGYVRTEGDTAAEVNDSNVNFTAGIRAICSSELHDRVVAVGDQGQIGYINFSGMGTANNWTLIDNGFAVTAVVTGVAFNETDGVFVAVADNGQICRSTNGTN